MSIVQVYPSTPAASPLDTFSLLLLNQGFPKKDFGSLVATYFPAKIILESTLSALAGKAKYAMSIFIDAKPPDFKVKQTADRLEVDTSRVTDYLSGHSLKVLKKSYDASSVWGESRLGRAGRLVAIMRDGSTAGELYQPGGSATSTVPLIAFNTAGKHWDRVLVRAVAQIIAGLADEYEFDGDGFKTMPDNYLVTAPNLIALRSNVRSGLSAGPVTNLGLLKWPSASSGLDFVPHESGTVDAGANPITTADGATRLVEGGGGFRHGVARGDGDCLMRRIPKGPGTAPANADKLPIQDNIGFCRVCQDAIQNAITGSPTFDLAHSQPVRLDTQRLLYDMIGWQTYAMKPNTQPTLPYQGNFTGTTGKPLWNFSVQLDATDGLILHSIKLGKRSDPFTTADNVARNILFTNLSVTYTDSTTAVPLAIADAFANKHMPPVMEVAGPSVDNHYQMGLKLLLNWDLKEAWIEVAMSLVLANERNDFDPGGGVVACKMYPQMALTHRSRPKCSDWKGRKKVAKLDGTIEITTNNSLQPKDFTAVQNLTNFYVEDDFSQFITDPGMMKMMMTGVQRASLFTDSNTAVGGDGKYRDYPMSSNATIAQIIVDDYLPGQFAPESPSVGVYEMQRDSGRALANISGDNAGTALHLFLRGLVPALPMWSWLFDYCQPALTVDGGGMKFTAVWLPEESPNALFKRSDDPNRQVSFRWPSDPRADATFMVARAPRQGAFDNVHVHADMMTDTTHNLPRVAAPFCADVCFHLHFRWGLGATASGLAPYIFAGWGNGRLDQGAHTLRGAPLIPPNQHLEVNVEPLSKAVTGSLGPSDDKAVTRISYHVSVNKPGLNESQVLLEQGTGLAYHYAIGYNTATGGISVDNLLGLAQATGVFGAGPPSAPLYYHMWQLQLTMSSGDAFDLSVRTLFDQIYDRLRWYDQSIDGLTDQQIPNSDCSDTKPAQTITITVKDV